MIISTRTREYSGKQQGELSEMGDCRKTGIKYQFEHKFVKSLTCVFPMSWEFMESHKQGSLATEVVFITKLKKGGYFSLNSL